MAKQTPIIDLRSDTLTLPCDGMRKAMAAAEVGDDVYEEDPTVKRLQDMLAEKTGKEAGLFFPSGTQSNLVALLSHCQRGEEYIVGMDAHTYKYEAGGAAVLGSIQPQPLVFEADGTLDLAKAEALIKEDDIHFAPTRLFALENTKAGRVLSLDYLDRAEAFARNNDLIFHLDGARVFNASVSLGIDVDRITRRFDSISICLSKGLGAPVGSVLVGERDVIERAKRWRKMVGGGMRQAGILAAAGIFAIENNIHRLQQDHELATQLATGLANIPGLDIEGDQSFTNMVFISCNDNNKLIRHADKQGLKIAGDIRLVTHKQQSSVDIDRSVEIIGEFFA